MAPKLKHLLGGLGLATAAICILPVVADSFGAAVVESARSYQVNRAIKTDRLMAPNMTVAKRKVPVETLRPPVRESEDAKPGETPKKREALDGCEPLFSPVSVPTLAHLSGRCIG